MLCLHNGPLRLENQKKVLDVARIAINIVSMLHMAGVDLVVSYLGSIVSWPVLLVADVCMT